MISEYTIKIAWTHADHCFSMKMDSILHAIISLKSISIILCILLIIAAGAVWKPIRKLLNPCFNLKILQSFVPIFNEKTNLMLSNMDKEVNKGLIDISQYMFACTLDMVCGTYAHLVRIERFGESSLSIGLYKNAAFVLQRLQWAIM